VAKNAIIEQERMWQHVINEQLLKLSLSLEALSHTKTIKISKPHSIVYKTKSTTIEAPGVVFNPATRQRPAPKPNNQTQGVVFTFITRHGFQPKDFLNILAAIPGNSKYVSDPTRPITTQYIPPTKTGQKTHSARPWVTHAPTLAPYHLESTIRLSYLLTVYHHPSNNKEDPEVRHQNGWTSE
jgi:hypothetical protein